MTPAFCAWAIMQRGRKLTCSVWTLTQLVRSIYHVKCHHLLAVPFLIAVIHIFVAAGLGGCCFEEPLIWELEYGDFAVKDIK